MVRLADEDERSGLHWAAAKGRHDVAAALLSRGAAADAADDSGWTPLMLACSAGHLPVVSVLLATKQVNVNAVNLQGCTALHYACSKAKVDIMQELLNAGARLNPRDRFGNTPLHRAVSCGSLAAVQLLLGMPGARQRVDDANGEGETALHVAVLERHADVAACLVRAGASLDAENGQHETPLQIAANKSYDVRDAILAAAHAMHKS
eukprot:TRINITY_DN3162_c0_g1_i4.p2 TRINITY_DN3162_c0_g1~~TRINITY_DN3162_c0_g1_i4.p2  ORF type:complete len:207 (-),score=72.33 TRINITY_DN3162_c0_g1_i4:59-679(-)